MIVEIALLWLQEGVGTPPPQAEPILEPSPVQVMVTPSALGALEEELWNLHQGLRPNLVQIRIDLDPEAKDPQFEPEWDLLVSGVFIAEGGYVVAPGPVEAGEGRISVVRFDGKTFPAKLIDADVDYGLILLKAPALGLKNPTFGHPSCMRVGSVAIGLSNPFGTLEGSLSLGFVAGKYRGLGQAKNLLQLSNPVNPGDGGGLVANRKGQLVGIMLTSMQQLGWSLAQSGEQDTQGWHRAQGISFAVPVDQVLRTFQKHLPWKLPPTPRLGVAIRQHFDPERRAALGLPGSWSLEVVEVVPGGPAAKAGMKKGDILLAIGGQNLVSTDCVAEVLWQVRGRTQMIFLRGEIRQQAQVQLQPVVAGSKH
ncbi:MAG: PDZ domain-containing protein [Planctomycetota bacterium]|nr:MAG: PDZ domain-containing protein [Planctomycetota bacterium]